MKRSHSVQLTLLSSLAAMLISCNHKPARYCVDDKNAVVDPSNCEYPRSAPPVIPYHWYYIRSRGSAPVGAVLTGGSAEMPSEGYSSGTVRGVMGAAGEEAAGGHGGGEAGAGE